MKRVFAFNYVLTGPDGAVIDKSENGQPLAFLEGVGHILPKLEEQILDMKEGDKKTVKLSAADAYGLPEAKMMMDVPREELTHLEGLQVGSYLQLQLQHDVKVVRVAKMTDSHVTLDGNHPLAGQDLVFDIELALVREATADEMAHGHAHGLHGHAHH